MSLRAGRLEQDLSAIAQRRRTGAGREGTADARWPAAKPRQKAARSAAASGPLWRRKGGKPRSGWDAGRLPSWLRTGAGNGRRSCMRSRKRSRRRSLCPSNRGRSGRGTRPSGRPRKGLAPASGTCPSPACGRASGRCGILGWNGRWAAREAPRQANRATIRKFFMRKGSSPRATARLRHRGMRQQASAP